MVFRSSYLFVLAVFLTAMGAGILTAAPSVAEEDDSAELYATCEYTECPRVKVKTDVWADIYYIKTQCKRHGQDGKEIPTSLSCSSPKVYVKCPGQSYVDGNYRTCRCDNPLIDVTNINFFATITCEK